MGEHGFNKTKKSLFATRTSHPSPSTYTSFGCQVFLWMPRPPLPRPPQPSPLSLASCQADPQSSMSASSATPWSLPSPGCGPPSEAFFSLAVLLSVFAPLLQSKPTTRGPETCQDGKDRAHRQKTCTRTPWHTLLDPGTIAVHSRGASNKNCLGNETCLRWLYESHPQVYLDAASDAKP